MVAPIAAADAERALAGSCRGCHGSAPTGGLPSLHGRDADELAATLLAFKRDERQGTLMNRLARGYSDSELRRIARYFATQPAASAEAPEP